jgi:HD-GYP domain-containing protein (c-di-GMP phosphodiesterase class II)
LRLGEGHAGRVALEARIFEVVNVWAALISDRPYRKALSMEKARRHIQSEAGKHFDPQVLDAFLKMKSVAAELGQRSNS